MAKISKTLTILILSLFHFQLQAQKLKKSPPLTPSETEGYVNVGFLVGAANYYGDIPSGPLFTRPAFGAYISRKLSPRIHGRLQVSWANVVGDDNAEDKNSGVYARNLHFQNQILETSLLASYDLIKSPGKHTKRKNFTPYVFTGITLFHHNPRAKIPEVLGNRWVELQPLGTEGQGRPGYKQPYSKIQFALPMGLGLKWTLDKRWDVGIETGVRFTFFDYLDDVSGDYPFLSDLANPLAIRMSNRTLEPVAARSGKERELQTLRERYGLSQVIGFDGNVYTTLQFFERGQSTRGNPNSLDMYFITAIHFSYIVNVGLKCPKFR